MSLRDDALRIWKAGVAAVDSAKLTRDQISIDPERGRLTICGSVFAIPSAGTAEHRPGQLRHIEVVGAGKAGAGMARGVESALVQIPRGLTISGWVNVPEDCVRALSHIHLHGARPPAINEPTAAAVAGTAEILRRVRELGPDDLCLVLISGGGSALLCQPMPPLTLQDKLAVTRTLAADGAPIHELNLVRTQLSAVKGGRLAAACRAGRLMALIISDVIGDPLDVIASGPTVVTPSRSGDALRLLKRRGLVDGKIPDSVIRFLQLATDRETSDRPGHRALAVPQNVSHHLIGTNQTAMTAAEAAARDLGYEVHSAGSHQQGDAADTGRELFAELTHRMHAARQKTGRPKKICVLSGGEPTVQLARTELARRGGRNQELVLAAIAANPSARDWHNMILLSGGTDGEDGPTDAAGAIADESVVNSMVSMELDPDSFLSINNSYPFFDQLSALIRTGPTHTNVMDLRVGLVDGN